MLPKVYGAWANLRNSGHLPVCPQICVGSEKIFTTAAICYWAAKIVQSLSISLRQRTLTSWPPNLYRVSADSHNRGHLPLCHQICIGSRQVLTTTAICHCATKFVRSLGRSPQVQASATKFVWGLSRSPQLQASATMLPNLYGAWAGFRKCRHLPVYHQIYIGLGQIIATAIIVTVPPYYIMESSSLLSAAPPPGRKRTQDINHDLGQRVQALAPATLDAPSSALRVGAP